MKYFKIKKFLGVELVDVGYNEFVNTIIDEIKISGPINIMSLNLTCLKRYNQDFQSFLDRFNYTTADGKGLVIFSGILGDKIHNHLSVPRLCDRLIEKCYHQNKKIFLLGAKKNINELAVMNIRMKFPGIIVRGHHGYFDLDNMSNVEGKIIRFEPDVVLVGISSPMKEKVILKLSAKYKKSINVACGGYLDIISGSISRAPDYLHRSGLEWLYRFYQEPKRMLGPMFTNALFFIFYILPKSLIYKLYYKKKPTLEEIININ